MRNIIIISIKLKSAESKEKKEEGNWDWYIICWQLWFPFGRLYIFAKSGIGLRDDYRSRERIVNAVIDVKYTCVILFIELFIVSPKNHFAFWKEKPLSSLRSTRSGEDLATKLCRVLTTLNTQIVVLSRSTMGIFYIAAHNVMYYFLIIYKPTPRVFVVYNNIFYIMHY